MAKEKSEGADRTILAEADQRRRRAIKYGVMVAVFAYFAMWVITALLKSMQPGGTTLNVTLLFVDVLRIAAPLSGYVVYRKMA